MYCANEAQMRNLGRYLEEEVQWNLDLSFLKGMEKKNDECGKTINPENYYTL